MLIPQRYEFSSKSQLMWTSLLRHSRCCWYHKGTNFQANHNVLFLLWIWKKVVADTTKVRIFKQITTSRRTCISESRLLLIPQRYEFSSKSQRTAIKMISFLRCCWYHKGTNFQANHNKALAEVGNLLVVADTTKVRIFKQITTKSAMQSAGMCCCWYHKGTNFQANHNVCQKCNMTS